MNPSIFLLSLACAGSAGDLGGHPAPTKVEEPDPADARRLKLEEMWQRGLLPPDQSAWGPADEDFLKRIRAVEEEATGYLTKRFGNVRPWAVRRRGAKTGQPLLLTRAGYERYMALVSQDAIAYFEDKGADAKWAFKLQTLDGKPLFDENGRLTDEGLRLYQRAALNLETYWAGADGTRYGTRRPAAKIP